MAYNVVTNSLIVNEVKKCRYFRTNLGLVTTVDKGGNRVFNEKDQFSYFYNTQYRTTIYAQGNVGDIKFYTDHFIKDPMMVVYYGDNNEEFIFDVDLKFLSEKGIDFYLGHILKEVETKYEERVATKTEKKMEPKKAGNSEMITFNPGAVTYEDLKAYMEKQNAERYKK